MGNHFFLDILSDNIGNKEECKQRASLLKWPSPTFRLLVFDVEHFWETIKHKPQEQIQDLKEKTHYLIKSNLQRISSKATVVMKSDSFTCLIPVTVAKDDIIALIRKICKEVSKKVSFTLTAGISTPSTSFMALKEQSFMKVSDNTYIQKYVRKVISELIDYDKQNDTYLFHTLKVLVECMGVKTKAAETLFLHLQTYLYLSNSSLPSVRLSWNHLKYHKALIANTFTDACKVCFPDTEPDASANSVVCVPTLSSSLI